MKQNRKELLRHIKTGRPFCLGVTANEIEARRIMDGTRRWVKRNKITHILDVHKIGDWIMAVWRAKQ